MNEMNEGAVNDMNGIPSNRKSKSQYQMKRKARIYKRGGFHRTQNIQSQQVSNNNYKVMTQKQKVFKAESN